MATRPAAAPRSPRHPEGAPMYIRAVMRSCALVFWFYYTLYSRKHEMRPIPFDLLNELGNGNFKDVCKFQCHILADRSNAIFQV